MAVMIAEAFTRYEPWRSPKACHSMGLWISSSCSGPKAEQEELTVLARDQETGQVIGAMLTEDFALAPPEGIEHFSEKFGAILTLLDELDAQYKQGISLRVGVYLHLLMIAVTHKHSSEKVAQNLIQACLENGIHHSHGQSSGVAQGPPQGWLVQVSPSQDGTKVGKDAFKGVFMSASRKLLASIYAVLKRLRPYEKPGMTGLSTEKGLQGV
jgi:hypothetical protein